MRKLIATAWSLLVLAGLMTGTIVAQDSRPAPAKALPGNYMSTAFQRGSDVPHGSYEESCQNIRRNGDRLEARCQKRDGGWRDTAIDYRGCRGQIVNDDGNLRCDTTGRWQGGYGQGGYWQGGMPQGNYQQTCQNVRRNGDRLEARCQKRDGGWRDTAIDYRGCRGQIVNDDGNLRCDTTGRWQGGYGQGGGYWQGGMPQGNYQQTCQNVRRNGDRLEARCQKRDGGWRDTAIDYRGCRGQIVNDDGNLRCDTTGRWQGGYGQGGYWQGGMPQGNYQQTCQNVRRNGDRLEARCQKRDGGWRDTAIDYRGCRGQIVNDDGNLRCQ